jgi:hypothetical protein
MLPPVSRFLVGIWFVVCQIPVVVLFHGAVRRPVLILPLRLRICNRLPSTRMRPRLTRPHVLPPAQQAGVMGAPAHHPKRVGIGGGGLAVGGVAGHGISGGRGVVADVKTRWACSSGQRPVIVLIGGLIHWPVVHSLAPDGHRRKQCWHVGCDVPGHRMFTIPPPVWWGVVDPCRPAMPGPPAQQSHHQCTHLRTPVA